MMFFFKLSLEGMWCWQRMPGWVLNSEHCLPASLCFYNLRLAGKSRGLHQTPSLWWRVYVCVCVAHRNMCCLLSGQPEVTHGSSPYAVIPQTRSSPTLNSFIRTFFALPSLPKKHSPLRLRLVTQMLIYFPSLVARVYDGNRYNAVIEFRDKLFTL